MDAKYDQQWCHQWWRFFMMINMRLIFLISMPFSKIYICPASFFFAVLSLATFSSNDWQNTTIDIIQWRYYAHQTLNRYGDPAKSLWQRTWEHQGLSHWVSGCALAHDTSQDPLLWCALSSYLWSIIFPLFFSILFLLLPGILHYERCHYTFDPCCKISRCNLTRREM